jgi:hypothetical protein
MFTEHVLISDIINCGRFVGMMRPADPGDSGDPPPPRQPENRAMQLTETVS